MGVLKSLYRWLDIRIGIGEVIEREFTGYLLPRNINSWYSLGSVLLTIFGPSGLLCTVI